MSNSWRPHGLQPTRLLHPWDFPGKSTGVGCHCLSCMCGQMISKGCSENSLTDRQSLNKQCGCNWAAAAATSLQSCPTLSNPMDCSLPDSSIRGIFQARVLEWGAVISTTAHLFVFYFSHFKFLRAIHFFCSSA